MTEKNIYIYPPDIPSSFLTLYGPSGPSGGGVARIHWGRLDVIHPRRQPDVSYISEAPKKPTKKVRRKK